MLDCESFATSDYSSCRQEREVRPIPAFQFYRGSTFMTSPEFVALSTKLFTDLNNWITEASKDELSASDLALLQAAMKVIERVTLSGAETKPDTAN